MTQMNLVRTEDFRIYVVAASGMLLMTLFCCIALICTDAEGAQSRTVTDLFGRTVVVPDKIDRVIAVGAATRFIVYMQSVDKLVGLEEFDKNLAENAIGRPYTEALRPYLSRLPSIGGGGAGRLPDVEKIISLKPDVIIAMAIDRAQIEGLQKKTMTTVVALDYGGRGILRNKPVQDSIRLLGQLLNRQKRAQDLIDYIGAIERDLSDRTKGKTPPLVYAGCISFKGAHGITSTESRYPAFKWLGLRNAADNVSIDGHIFIEKERLLQWNPQYIFIDTGGFDMLQTDARKNPSYYKSLEAVRGNRVFTVLPYNFYSTNIETALANAYAIGNAVYPDRFSDINVDKKAEDIIGFFTGRRSYKLLKQQFNGYGRLTFTERGIEIN